MQQTPLRLMTFNLLTSTKLRRTHPWRLRKYGVARIFRKYQPDVVGTQEANLHQLLELSELLPDYEFLGVGNLSGTALADSVHNWYCAVFYRRDTVRPAEEEGDAYWLSPTPEVPGSQFQLGTRPRLATWYTFEHIPTRRDFVFGTTHLEAISGRHRQKSADLLGGYIADKVRSMGEETPLFLTGDFNAVASSPEIRRLHSRVAGDGVSLFDAWKEAGSADPLAGATFRGLGRWGQFSQLLMGPRRIDYIFFRPQLQVLKARKIHFDGIVSSKHALPSDHFPVLADFLLDGRSAA